MSADAPVNAPLRWPKSSLSSSVSESAPQLTATNGSAAARSVVVDGAGDELLAGAGLAGDEHGDRRGGGAGQEAEDALHRGAVADDAVEAAVARHLLLQHVDRIAQARRRALRVAVAARVVDGDRDALRQRGDELDVFAGEAAVELVAQRQDADDPVAGAQRRAQQRARRHAGLPVDAAVPARILR